MWEDKNFGQIGKSWKEKLKSKGIVVIEQLGNVMLRLEIEKDNILANWETLSTKNEKCEDCISLLHMVLQMKAKEVVEAKLI